MTTHLRYAIGTAIAGLIFTGIAAVLVLDGRAWLGLCALGSAFLLACDTRREAVLRQRRLAEHHLALRRSRGQTVPALDPCCLLAPRTKGQAHDHRCTLPAAHALPADDTKAGWTAYERLAGSDVRTECPCGCGRPWSAGARS